MAEKVDHPAHYNAGTIEVIDVIEDRGWGEAFNRGNAAKYILRAGLKDPDKEIQDLEKAAWYLEREIQRLMLKRDGELAAAGDLEAFGFKDEPTPPNGTPQKPTIKAPELPSEPETPMMPPPPTPEPDPPAERLPLHVKPKWADEGESWNCARCGGKKHTRERYENPAGARFCARCVSEAHLGVKRDSR